MSLSSLLLMRKPSKAVSWTVMLAAAGVWVILRLVIFRAFLFPLTYALPLLLCVWTRDRAMLWGMAAAFSILHTVNELSLLPRASGNFVEWATWGATQFNIFVAAVLVHAIIDMREHLQTSLDRVEAQAEELARQNEDLSGQSEELSRQGEELSQQMEELSQQSEELSRQNEELQAQSEEIGALNAELGHRESLLDMLLDAARLEGGERAAMQKICRVAMEMLGPSADAVVVYERREGRLVIRGGAGVDESVRDAEPQRSEHRFVDLVIEENRTACLNDTSLRPDLAVLRVPGQPPFRAVLCAPLQSAGEAFGAVAIYSRAKQEWTTQHFRIAEWLAGRSVNILAILRLQETLRRQSALIDLSPDGIMVRRMDGTITLWSRGAELLYGWTKQEAIGATTHSLLRARLPKPLSEIEAELERTGRWTGEIVHTAKDGREIVVQSRWLARRDARGTIAELLESNVDVSDRKRTEEALREADRRKNEFLATLSHELRNPLAPIRYALELIDQDHPVPSQPKQVIERQLTHLVRLVDDLLDMTRVASNKIRLRKQRVELAAIVQQAVESTMRDIEQARHSLVISLPPEAIWLDADADRLAQVLTNLLANAARYTPEGGRIGVTAAAVQDEVIVSVTDTGIGLSAEDLARVFEMFAQVGEPGHGGLGIGLALVKGLVELHGGSVEARSGGLGRGSEFRLRLPRAAQAMPASGGQALADSPQPGTRRRILVVDDNADSADMMRTFLEMHGHEVHVAYDGISALEAARTIRPDIGLFDIGLPGMSGYDLAQEMRRDPANGHVYLVAVTGWGQEDDRQRARDCGFDAHLTKPAEPEDLRRLIAEAGTRLGA